MALFSPLRDCSGHGGYDEESMQVTISVFQMVFVRDVFLITK
jgi:hypothetical protein